MQAATSVGVLAARVLAMHKAARLAEARTHVACEPCSSLTLQASPTNLL